MAGRGDQMDDAGTCAGIRPQLGVYLTGAIGPADRAAVVRHLGACADCRAELAGLAALPGLLRRPPVQAAAQAVPEDEAGLDDATGDGEAAVASSRPASSSGTAWAAAWTDGRRSRPGSAASPASSARQSAHAARCRTTAARSAGAIAPVRYTPNCGRIPAHVPASSI